MKTNSLEVLQNFGFANGGVRSRRAFLPVWLVCSVLLAFAPAAHAQWQSVTYTLKGGWSSIYLHGDATHASIDTLVESNPEVLEIWRWNPNPNPALIGGSSLTPSASSPEWSMWRRGQPTQSTLASLSGQAAYLVKCSGGSTDTYVLALPQKILPPKSTWVRNGANLLGFPTRLGAVYPTFAAYFATFPVAISTNAKIYRYDGGDIGPSNPIPLYSTTTDRVDRNQAYWFDATVVGDFYAPLEISPSSLDGLHYGRNGAIFTVRVRNRTSGVITLTIAPLDSARAPTGQETVLAPVPITRRTFDAVTGADTETLIATAYTETIAPQTSVELSFGIDRARITGAVDSLYASFLRFTDSGNLMDVLMPVSARVPSLAGLWVGDVAVTDVANKSPARSYTCEVDNGKFTVESRAAALGGSSLRPISLPVGGGPYTFKWKRDGVAISGATSSTFELTSAEAAELGVFGSRTARAFSLRVILHIDNSGTARLLSQVYLGTLAAAPANGTGLTTVESALKADEKASARRLVSTHLPVEAVIGGSGGVTPGGEPLVRTILIGYDDDTNPFVHRYHPDHDNKNDRGEPIGRGQESYDLKRTCTFQFLKDSPDNTSAAVWGASVIGGLYSEVVTGLHKDPVSVQGTFRLNRISEVGSITLN